MNKEGTIVPRQGWLWLAPGRKAASPQAERAKKRRRIQERKSRGIRFFMNQTSFHEKGVVTRMREQKKACFRHREAVPLIG